MVEIDLIGDNVNNKKRFIWKDKSGIDVAGIVVDNDTYDTGTHLDRDYDVRSHDGVSILIENQGANSIDYTILGATKDFAMNAMDATLVDADFAEVLVAEAALAATTRAVPFDLERVTPSITAIRIRVKETTAAMPGNLRADIKAF